jgi:hypothetical protein
MQALWHPLDAALPSEDVSLPPARVLLEVG